MTRSSVAMAVAIELALQGMAFAADPRFPDWPCNQVKVPEISVAAVWAGPAIDDVGNAWEEDATIRDLVAQLAVRRTPLDDAPRNADVIAETRVTLMVLRGSSMQELERECPQLARRISRSVTHRRDWLEPVS